MSEAALFIRWGEPARGREEQAVEEFESTIRYYERLRQESRIERYELAFLTPYGGDLTGFILVRGTMEQINSLRHDDEFRQWVNRVRLVADHFGVVDADVDEKLATTMLQFRDEVRGRDF